MSGANDPYDPEQVAALPPEALDDAVDAARKAFGAAADLAALADARVRIPMRGRAESLDLAVAAAICLYTTQLAQG